MVTTLILLGSLLAASAFFSASETSMVSVGRLRARMLAEKDRPGAQTLQALLEDPNRLLSTILIGNNIVNILASSVATALAIERFGAAGTGIAAAVMTIAILLFGEVLPKSYAANAADGVALAVARPISWLSTLMKPLVAAFSWVIVQVVQGLGGSAEADFTVTEEEIRSLITLGYKQGVLDPGEEEILHSVFEFRDTVASELMTPRLDVPSVEVSDSVDTAAARMLEHGVSRLAAYETTPDNLVGVVHIEDVLRVKVERDGVQVGTIMRPALVVPESKPVGTLFEQMRQQRVSAAIVADEYGSSSGLITLDDLVEDIVGDLWDEHDPQGEERIKTVDERSSLIDGRLSIDEVNDAFGICLPTEYSHTLGGWIFHLLGRLPKVGDVVQAEGVEFRVESMEHWRVDRVRVRRL